MSRHHGCSKCSGLKTQRRAAQRGDKFSQEMELGEKTLDRNWEKLRDQLRDNERIWAGFRQIEVQMIGSNSFTDLVKVITRGIPEAFSGIDCVTLAFVDPDYEMSRP